jgi:hypothetical protein
MSADDHEQEESPEDRRRRLDAAYRLCVIGGQSGSATPVMRSDG